MPTRAAASRVGRYEIVRELGRGGMATVYLARQTDLDRLVALKELGGFYVSDPSFAERFLRESRVTSSLNHPNIVTVHDYFEHDGTPYISMEYVERGSLRPFVETLSLPQAVGVLEQLLAGLAHAESRGIVHRDLKPENVMVTAEGTVKIADFGIAKAINQNAPGSMLTGTGTLLGTPDYMAPEQALAGQIGPWTDLYSLGVMAYEMVAGRVPFQGTTTPMAILLKHVNEQIPPVREVNPALDRNLSCWVDRLLVKDPETRTRRASDASEHLVEIAVEMFGPRWERGARLTDSSRVQETQRALSPPPRPHDLVDREDGESAVGTVAAGSRSTPVPATEAALAVAPEAVRLAEASSKGAVEVTQAARAESTLPGAPREAIGDGVPPLPPDQRTPSGRGRQGRRMGLVLALIALGVAGVVAAVLAVSLGGGDSAKSAATTAVSTAATESAASATTQASAETTATTTEAVPAAALSASDRLGLALGPDTVVVSDPGGWVATLDPSSLQQLRALPSPASPGALAASAGNVVVVDDETVTVLRAGDLAPISSAKFGPDAQVVAADDTVAIARPTGEAKGRLCLLENGKPDPCADLPFRPSGLGVTTDGTRIFVASSADGAIEYTVADGSLSGNAVEIEGEPSGTMVEFRKKLYVPVSNGVAIYDLASGAVTGTISLGGRPAAVWVAPASGNLFAALPDVNEVAVVDTASPASEPTRVHVGKRPVALAGGDSGDAVYVANAGDGTVSRLDPLTGAVLGTRRIRALRSRSQQSVTAAGIEMTKSGQDTDGYDPTRRGALACVRPRCANPQHRRRTRCRRTVAGWHRSDRRRRRARWSCCRRHASTGAAGRHSLGGEELLRELHRATERRRGGCCADRHRTCDRDELVVYRVVV